MAPGFGRREAVPCSRSVRVFPPPSTGTSMRYSVSLGLAALIATTGCGNQLTSGSSSAEPPAFTLKAVMIPVRDGVHLQTVILTPINQSGPLPILFRRTPYGVPDSAPHGIPANMKELAQDGYIFVIQNLRGRFKSEGVFNLSSQVDLTDPKATNEATDAYDSIDWLIKNVPNNNGKVGAYGVSYDGLTTGLTLLHPHPALKAMSEQASPVDQWMNDDMHRYGALRESYAFEYAVLEQADKNKNTNFKFETYDSYQWYLNLGPLSNVNAKYLHGTIPFWNETMEHPNYDEFWKKEAWVNQLHSSTVPNLNVAGFWDQEDPWGPWQIFRHAARTRSRSYELHGRRSLVSWRMAVTQGRQHWPDSVSAVTRRRASSGSRSRRPSSATTCTATGTKPAWQATTFQAGSNRWRITTRGRRRRPSRRICIYTPMARCPSTAPTTGNREYVSDPANPVPYRRASDLSRRIRRAIGEPGRSRTSDS